MRVLLDRARQALLSAEALARLGDENGAANRAYFAVFDAMRAVLVEVVRLEPRAYKTHSGVTRGFELEIVKAGLLERSVGRTVKRIAERRWAADYGSDMIQGSDPNALVREAQGFVDACAALIADRAPDR